MARVLLHLSQRKKSNQSETPEEREQEGGVSALTSGLSCKINHKHKHMQGSVSHTVTVQISALKHQPCHATSTNDKHMQGSISAEEGGSRTLDRIKQQQILV